MPPKSADAASSAAGELSTAPRTSGRSSMARRLVGANDVIAAAECRARAAGAAPPAARRKSMRRKPRPPPPRGRGA
jgi:hypothetical protein